MKKRLLSAFMVLALCLTLLPTAALAAETEGTAQTPPAVEKAADPANGEEQQENQPAAPKQENQSAEQEEQQEDPAVKQAVAAVQALIDALPDAAELDGMNDEDAMAVYEAFQTACDAYYDTLTEEQQAQLKNTEKLAALSEWFNAQVAPLENSGDIYPDVVDANGGITAGTSFSRNGPIVENSDDSTTFYGNQYYVVKESSNVTINGDLIIDSCTNNGLILCKGATLTVTGALIHKGGTFPIYGVSDSGQNAGRLVVKNSLDDGAAIRSAAADSMLNIYSGALTIKGGSSSKLVDGVELHNASKIYAATLSGNAASYKDWSEKSSLTGTSLVLEYCGHSSDYERYVDNSDGTHHMKCDLCGFEWTKGEYSKLDHEYDKYEKINETYHKATCVCGYEASAQEHKFETGPDNKPVWTSDGKGHVSGVCACGYSSGTVDAHDYDEFGTCKDCGFKPAFEDSKGNLYEYNGSDSIDALNEAIKKGETSFKLVNFAQGEGADAATVEAAFALETDANVTLDMNGKTLKASGGTPVLAVSSGALTVTGDAAIIQGGASQEMYKPAIEVTGGSLVFEGDLTAQGGKCGNYDRQPAVKATGGTVEFKGVLNLDGGLFLDSCERLASKLTQGRFYSDNNDQGQVYRVQIENDFQHSYDLLADGYAFAKYDTADGKVKVDENGNPVLVDAKLSSLPMNTDVIIVAHTHSIEEGQPACACGKKLEAGIPAGDGTITYYETIDEAFANVKANETVKLMIDSDDRDRQDYIYVVGGPYTFDLNGHRVGHRTDDDNRHQAFLQVGDPDGNLGTLTVLDSSAAQTGYFYELELYNGSLTVESGSFYRYWESATTATGTMTFKGGTVDVFTVTSRNVETKISGGTFGLVENNIGGKPGDLLADNRAFFNRGNDSFVNGYDDRYQAVRDVVVKEHTHNIVDGSCECGFTCAHDWSDKNGVCKKTNCGYHCPHPAGSVSNGSEGQESIYTCLTCNAQMAVKITASDSTVTYGTDFKAAMNAAVGGTKITLLADVSIQGRTGISGDNTTVTLDLNEHKITSGWLDVGGKDTNGIYTACTLKIIGKGSYEPPMYGGIITVDLKATLDLSEWEGGTISSINISDNSNYEAATREAAVIVGPKAGTIGNLSFGNNQLDELKKTKLSGGSFNEIWVAGFGPVKLGELLADGYAFQNEDGPYVKYETTLQGASIFNVKVVKCLHPNMKPDATTGIATCEYCGKSGKFVASVDGNLYTDMNGAISYWLANGGTLKLYADYTAADGTWSIGSGLHTINLNGHRMSVKGDGAFKPTNNMHLTVTDGTEIGQIENILLDGNQGGSFTLESGYVCNLEMTGGAVVALKGGSVDKLDVQNSSANTKLSIQGGSIGELNIKDWADGMHVSATSGSLGAYNLPSGKILADVLDHQYYAEGTSLDKGVDAAQKPEKFVIKQATYDFESTSKTAEVPINGRIPFMVDSPSGDATGYYDVRWYRRTDSGAVDMTENRVAGVNVNDTLDVFCVITGADHPGGEMQWQVAVKGYTIKVVPVKLNGDQTVITQKPNTGNTGNPADNRLVVTPFSSNALNNVEYKFEVTYNGQPLELDKDYTIKDSSNLAMNAGTHTLTIEGMGNYTGEKSVTWTLEPYELSVENFCHAQINKTYDGTDAVTDSTNGINALDGFIPDSKNPRNPILSTGDNLNLDKSDYQLSNMKFDSAEAGDRTFTGTMTLTSGGNFVFANGSRVMQIEYGSVSGRQFVWISSATIAAPAAKALQVANNHAATYTVDLSALLPALEAPREYGAVTYGAPTVNLSSGYYAVGTAKIENGKLILPIQAVKTDTTGSIGSVEVKVSTTNYHDFTLTINVSAKNRLTPTGLTAKYGQTLADVTLPDGWSWMDSSESVGDASNAPKTFRAKFTPTDTANYNTVENIELGVTVNKAHGGSLKTVELTQKYTDTSEHTYTPDWLGLPDGQTWSYSSEYSVNTGSNVTLTKQDFAADGSLLTYAISGGKAGDKITITLKASCDNYGDFTNTLNITLTARDDQTPLTITGDTSVIYGEKLTLTTTGGSGTGAVTYTVTNGTGEATIDSNGVLTPVRIGSVTVTATKAGDSEYNAVTSSPVEITITRATPTGEPKYTAITTSGKTLSDAALTTTGGTFSVLGTVKWVDDTGAELPPTTTVEANKSYSWVFTPTDTANYKSINGSIKLWSKSAGGGSGRTAAVVAPDMPMLYRGCTGDVVKTLQEKLNAKGFDSGNVDGIFGAKTYAAVAAFQKANGLGVDGIVGKLTWGKLYGVSPAMPVETTTVVGRPMVSYGSRGDAVRKLQELLNALGYDCGSVDGIFGSKTKAAVLAFQKANGLGADGIVGPLTWAKLG